MANTDQFEGRLRNVETNVATIKERLNHMPTKSEMHEMITGAQTKIIVAIAVALLAAVVKWMWPVLFGGGAIAN